jgi:hypothetical protein
MVAQNSELNFDVSQTIDSIENYLQGANRGLERVKF